MACRAAHYPELHAAAAKRGEAPPQVCIRRCRSRCLLSTDLAAVP